MCIRGAHEYRAWYALAFIRTTIPVGVLLEAGYGPADLETAARPHPPSTYALGEGEIEREQLGSNGWVIGPAKSATRHAMLFINPHLSFFGYGQVYEGHVHSKESGWNFTGYTRFGFPFPYVGHNESLGWVSTDNSGDQADLYAEVFEDSTRYRYGDGFRRATIWIDTIVVKTVTGVERRPITLRKTHHGPIIGSRDGKPLRADGS